MTHDSGRLAGQQGEPGSADPPTRLQRPDEPEDGPTRLQPRLGSSSDPPTRLQRPDRRPAAALVGDLPAELAERFRLVPGPDGSARLGSGAEAEVWLVWDAQQEQHMALKIYHYDPLDDPHRTFDTVLRRRLADPAFRAHVPELYDWGFASGRNGREVAWEAMEYFELGSLADLVRREAPSGRLDQARAMEVIRAALDALVFWEDVIRQRQIDLSPGNVLVRRAEPLTFVLSDFGGVRGTGLSQEIGPLQVKLGYMAPEALGNCNDAKSPYWSLGMICYQILMGRSIIADHHEDAFRVILATNDIDVSAVPDERWRLLIEGLLTRKLDERWGPREVRDWLEGGFPRVHRVLRSRRPAQTLTFADKEFDDRRLLAGEMMVRSDLAVQWLTTGGAARLRAWLASFDDRPLDDHPFDVLHLSGVENDRWRATLAVARFCAAFLHDQRPLFRGVPVDVAGITRLAQDPGAASRQLLHQVVDHDVLRIAALHDCAHPDCTGRHCLVLRDLGDKIAAASALAAERLGGVGRRLAADALAADMLGSTPLTRSLDVERTYANCAEILVSPDRVGRIVGRIRRARLPRANWWRDIERDALRADPRTVDGAAALCVAAELADLARAYRLAEDRRRQIAARQRAGSALSWIGQQLTRNPSGRQRVFTSPRWIERLLLIVVPFACVEPVYFGIVRSHQLTENVSVMTTASKVMDAMQPYTKWSADWLTPWLSAHWQVQPWKIFAAYPVVIILALTVIRRSRRGSAVRSWLAVPTIIIGLLFAIAIVMRLTWEDFSTIWATVAALKVLACAAPIGGLIAVRVFAGPANADRPYANRAYAR